MGALNTGGFCIGLGNLVWVAEVLDELSMLCLLLGGASEGGGVSVEALEEEVEVGGRVGGGMCKRCDGWLDAGENFDHSDVLL